MISAAWEHTDEHQPTIRERLRNASAFAVWFVFGSHAAKRFAARGT
jgi:hypothetical protein